MELALISVKQTITMFLIVFVGILCYRTKLISKENNKALSAVVLNIVNPAVIFMSYQVEFEMRLLQGLGISIGLSALTFAVMILMANILIRKQGNADWNIERIALIYSNCGFIGIPMIRALVGEIGVFYVASYLTMFNLLLWTHGVMVMTGKSDIKSVVKAMTSPCVIAVFLGILAFVCRLQLPDMVGNAVSSIADMNTPLAMLVAGVVIAQTNLPAVLKRVRMYYMCILKLLVIPAVIVLLMLPFAKMGVDHDILLTVIIATACPTGASGTLFALRYQGNELYASEIFGTTTLLSLVSIPLIVMLAGLIL